jgi:decaprenyl-phosphate phosphoribosyltransferase
VVREQTELRQPREQPSLFSGLVKTSRPKQWVKNVLVFAAPGAAGVIGESAPLRNTLTALVAFCFAASGTYFLNDAADVDSDRRHPKKRLRPVASGIVPVTTARVVGVTLLALGIGISFTARWQLAATVGAYIALTSLYSAVLKHIAVVDIVAVAAGFVLRAVAGATASDVPISNWFFIVASFGALFMVAGKRQAEGKQIGADAAQLRSTLGEYSEPYLAYLRSVSSSAVLMAYCLWAFEKANEAVHSDPWYQISIGPFVLGVLRYALLIDKGQGAAPEDVVLGDRPLQVIGLLWVIAFGLGVYLA